MSLVYTINWQKVWDKNTPPGNFITLRITCIDQQGKILYLNKYYEEWFGICTDNIKSLMRNMSYFFPTMKIRFERINKDSLYKKVLPYFRDRLKTKIFEYENHPFYKVFIDSGSLEDVGFFFNKYDISYFHKSDWLIRVYIDLCTKYNTKNGFFYRWYNVKHDQPFLMDSFQMETEINDMPNWKFAAFDIETVPMSGEDRIPNGLDPLDKIVMISIIKWDDNTKKEYVLYLNPNSLEGKLKFENNNTSTYLEYTSEKKLLNDFHYLIQDCHVITGYNINKFDIPCIFARLLWLGQYNILKQYSSSKIGDYLITTFQKKIVIDVYNYFQIFSNYDLSSFKLDNVAKIKLGLEEGKISIDSVGIHSWYVKQQLVTRELCLSSDNRYCFNVLQPSKVHSVDRFGTFLQYLEYCLRDSELVYRLFLKEMILGFLTARANFVAMDAVHAMHLGNSRFLLELFKTYGNLLEFYVNIDFFRNDTDGTKYTSMFVGDTYQGALNYCLSEQYFTNVVTLDFLSMYPISLLSSNLCYGTCDILTAEEYKHSLTNEEKKYLTAIPYRVHSDKDFTDNNKTEKVFKYPSFNPEIDRFVMVINQHVKAFLPTVVEHFITTRQYHQKMWKETHNVIHYNTQLCIKILINSMYGVMAAKDSPLAYIVIAMTIVTLARYQLLGSYHFVKNLGYTVCYADTDSLMVHRWPDNHCNIINEYLNIPYVNLKFEHRMERLLILSKKRYIYDINGIIHTKGFQKKINDLVKFMSNKIINNVMNLNGCFGNPEDGWILWVNVLLETLFMCRDPKKYSITRKTKKMDEYVSKSCAAVKMLQKYPEKEGGYIDYTYSRADVSVKEASKWIMDVGDCQYVNFEQLFISQKKILITLLNIGYWKLPNPHIPCNMIINTIRWKFFVHAELKHYFQTRKRKIMLLVEKGVKYTFKINDYCANPTGKRKTVVIKHLKRKLDVIDEYKIKRKLIKPLKRKLDVIDEYKINRKLMKKDES